MLSNAPAIIGIVFTKEPRDVVVRCGAGQVAVFPCQYSGSLAYPYWDINLTEYSSVALPPDHSYSSGLLRVSNVNEKNGTHYQCFLLSIQNGAICVYKSSIGRLFLNCKGKAFNFLSISYLIKSDLQILTYKALPLIAIMTIKP